MQTSSLTIQSTFLLNETDDLLKLLLFPPARPNSDEVSLIVLVSKIVAWKYKKQSSEALSMLMKRYKDRG